MLNEIKETDEKRVRENNLILYNIKESRKEQGKERAKEDKNRCDQIFREGLGIIEYGMVTVVRLGKIQNIEERARPVLIKFENMNQKWAILKKAKNLRHSENIEFKQCIVAPDLTVREQEFDKKLRQELKEKRDKGENGWIIRKGKLFQKNFH